MEKLKVAIAGKPSCNCNRFMKLFLLELYCWIVFCDFICMNSCSKKFKPISHPSQFSCDSFCLVDPVYMTESDQTLTQLTRPDQTVADSV